MVSEIFEITPTDFEMLSTPAYMHRYPILQDDPLVLACTGTELKERGNGDTDAYMEQGMYLLGLVVWSEIP